MHVNRTRKERSNRIIGVADERKESMCCGCYCC